MAKHNNNGRSKNPDGQYIKLLYFIIKSQAWRSLNPSSIKVYLEFHTIFNFRNNGNIYIGLDKLSKNLGMSKSTVLRAFTELENHGFLAKTKNGNWIKGQAATWRLTTQKCGNDGPTNDWNKWQGAPKKEKERQPYGYSKQKHRDYYNQEQNELSGTKIEPNSVLK